MIDSKKGKIPAAPEYPRRRQVARFLSETSSALSATYLVSIGVGTGRGTISSLSAIRLAPYALRDLRVDGVVTGAVESDYQKSRIDGACHNLGLRCFSPLWRRS